MSETSVERRPSKYATYMLGGAAVIVVFGIIQSPGEAFRASLAGLQIWWQHVFPGLLPPLILAELLAASGLLHGFSTLAEPLTRSLFKLPGAAGWAMAFGWSAGIPAGAKETARLRSAGLIRKQDTGLLLFLSHMPNPFLVVIIVGAGLLQSPMLGWAIAAGIWSAAIVVGFFWAHLAASRAGYPSAAIGNGALIRRSVRIAEEARQTDGRPFGRQLADGVTNAVATLMSIGGLMMMAAVVLRLLQIGLPGVDVWLAIPGLYEMHLGAFESARSPLFESAPARAAALLAAALAWTGWSSLLQARAAFGESGEFPWSQLIASKLLQSALALLITFLLAKAALAQSAAGMSLFQSPFGTWTREALAGGGGVWNGWTRLPEIWLSGLTRLGVFLLLALLAAILRPNSGRRKGPPPPSD